MQTNNKPMQKTKLTKAQHNKLIKILIKYRDTKHPELGVYDCIAYSEAFLEDLEQFVANEIEKARRRNVRYKKP